MGYPERMSLAVWVVLGIVVLATFAPWQIVRKSWHRCLRGFRTGNWKSSL